MPFSSSCPGCNAKFNLGDPLLGKKVTCPKCKQPFVAQASAKPDTRVSKVIGAPVGAGAKMPSNSPAPRAKRSVLPWVIAGVMVLVGGFVFVSVGIGAVVWYNLRSSKPESVAVRPADS